MKKIILSISILFGLNIYSQNTIPTTTVTGALSVNDSLHVYKDITTAGDITSKGEVVSKDTMRAQKDILIDGNAKVGGDLSVQGNINTSGSLYIKNKQVIGVQPFPPVPNPTVDPVTTPQSPPTSTTIYSYGGEPGPLQTQNTCSDGEYNVWSSHILGGVAQIYDNSGNGSTYNNGGSILTMASWPSKSSIDVSGGIGGAGGLLMNYFCGKDISMCQGTNGGVITMGKNLEIGNVWNRDLTTNLYINTGQTGVTKALKVFNVNNGNVFTVFSNGRTQIGLGQPKAGGLAANAMLSVDGLVLAKEIRVAIANTHWADYVFEKEYKLMPLKDVEKYIAANKHLPEVPSTIEVENNGIDMVEINASLLKKIEELTLYLIEQNKRIEKLEKENVSLNSKK